MELVGLTFVCFGGEAKPAFGIVMVDDDIGDCAYAVLAECLNHGAKLFFAAE